MTATIYTVGGTVQAGGGRYIPRKADDELLALCRAATFGYVLAPRQVGKSSLMVHTAERLADEGIQSAIIDLTQIGAQVTAEAWYLGLLTTLEDQLMLDTSVAAWWREHAYLGYTQRLTLYFQDVLLREVDAPLVIFVDEIDTTLGLDFTDDFYAAIRYLYNARATILEFKRLSFVLIGVATPGDLVRDPKRTPFNVGQRVDLEDWTLDEAAPLAEGLGLPTDEARQALAWMIRWTGGHPYLTQRLCQAFTARAGREWSTNTIDRAVAETFFGPKSEQDNNLQFVRDMLTRRAPDEAAVLTTYRAILHARQAIPDEEQSIVKTHLKLSGVVRREGSGLRVRNQIYRTVFDERWVREHLPPDYWTARVRRAARLVAGLSILSLVLAGLAIFAVINANTAERERTRADNNAGAAEARRQEAEAQRQEAEAARGTAEARRQQAETAQSMAEAHRLEAQAERDQAATQGLAFRSLTLPNPEQGLLLAIEAAGRVEQQRIKDTNRQIEAVLYQAVQASHLRATFQGHTGWVWSAQFSPDGQQVVTASTDGSARVWEAVGGQQLALLQGHTDWVLSAQFSPDGQQVVTASTDGSARVWEAAGGQQLALLQADTDWVLSAQFSPDGQQIVTASTDGSTRVWEAAGGQQLALLQGHTGSVNSAQFSPDGQQIVTASVDGSARVWEVAGGQQLALLQGHTGSVNSAEFSPDGQHILTTSADRTARVWEAASGVLIFTVGGGLEPISVAAWSPDSRRIITAGADGTARIYVANFDELLAQARTRVTRQLTCEERLIYLQEDIVCPTPTPAPATPTP